MSKPVSTALISFGICFFLSWAYFSHVAWWLVLLMAALFAAEIYFFIWLRKRDDEKFKQAMIAFSNQLKVSVEDVRMSANHRWAMGLLQNLVAIAMEMDTHASKYGTDNAAFRSIKKEYDATRAEYESFILEHPLGEVK
jgi:hypothetical protein